MGASLRKLRAERTAAQAPTPAPEPPENARVAPEAPSPPKLPEARPQPPKKR